MTRIFALLALLPLARAQAPQTPAANVSVSGTVKDAGTGQPLANFNVSTFVNVTWLNDTVLQSRETKTVNSVTDEHGRYRLSGLPPGTYRIDARSREFGSTRQRHVTVSGQDLDGIDFSVKVNGLISGKVLDENKEPLPGMTVNLVSREYYSGALGYFLKDSTLTNDRGEYTLRRVEAGRTYLVMAEKRDRRLPTHSDVPLDSRLRRPALIRTFYPNSPVKEGGAPLVIRPGEHREGVDIEIKKSRNFCVEGIVSGPLGPAALNFGIEGTQPSAGMSSTGGMFGLPPMGVSAPDGKFRVCNLSPGAYRFTAWETGPGQGLRQTLASHALMTLAISDQDLANVRANLGAGPSLPGEVVIAGAAPSEPITVKLSLRLVALLRSDMPGESFSGRSDIPGTFSIDGLIVSDYAVRPLLNLPGFYVKDITYAGNSVMYEPLHVGAAQEGAGLRVTVSGDGATLNAKVSDAAGNPGADIRVLVLPKDISSEAMLQAALVTGVTDQLGNYRSHTLAPGKYYILATNDTFDATPESIGRLWRFRNHFQEVELAPGGSAQVTIQPVTVE